MALLTKLIAIFLAHGYLAVFVALLLTGVGVPIPEDIILVSGGVITGLGYGHVWLMIAVAMAGILVTDLALFYAGYRFGPQVLRWRPLARIVTPARFRKVGRGFTRYGNRLLFFSRFLPGLRVAVYLIAGMTRRVSALRFLAIDASAAAISVPIWVYLGHTGAENQEALLRAVHHGKAGILVAVVLIALGGGVYWLVARRRRRDRAG